VIGASFRHYIERSGHPQIELLYHPDEYNKVVIFGAPLRDAASRGDGTVLNKLKKTRSNIEFLLSMAVG